MILIVRFDFLIFISFQLQFTLVFFHSAQVLMYDCGYPKLVAVLLLIHSIIFFALFSDFYIQAYIRKMGPRQLFKFKSS